ncbi:ABC transporter substrate-binding protein [Propionivibrio dicarboxylicus]|uniref:Multiple sugar transport system substrate-binding protein n=1 Tax=Propionivibrio dicarboxylicus TaxID=83767 RepID=A0A1G8CVJ6_9RHOO|nr:ABC transporter substrate-binding protein [Propionivibrio dicarboxylicus]SDH49557.1 multiple sugar transport system substrate-binding protein [Propionivibrio dicarboxylicus]
MKKSMLGVLLACLSICIFLGSGCDGRPGRRTETVPKTAVTLLHYFTDSLSGGIAELAQTFNSRHPRYELKAISLDHEAFKSSIYDTLRSGNPPDLYSYWAGARTASIIDQLDPIDDLWREGEFDKLFSPAVAQAASDYDGHKYLVPMTQHYIGFFYNKGVFSQYKLKPPETWNDLLNACTRLRAAGVVPIALGAQDKWPAQFWFDLLLLRTAPFEFRQGLMNGSERFDDAKVIAVFARWKTLIDRGCFNRAPHPNDLSWDAGANEMVFRGEAAMTLMGTWTIGYFENAKHAWKAGTDYDFFPFPVVNPAIPRVSIGPIDGLVMPKRASNPEGAKAALLLMAQEDAQKAFSRGSGALAPNVRVEDGFYSDIQRRVRDEIARSQRFAFSFDLAAPPAVATLGLDAFAEFLAFPDSYRQIVHDLADRSAESFKSLSPSR